jgi:hypothetical protein
MVSGLQSSQHMRHNCESCQKQGAGSREDECPRAAVRMSAREQNESLEISTHTHTIIITTSQSTGTLVLVLVVWCTRCSCSGVLATSWYCAGAGAALVVLVLY